MLRETSQRPKNAYCMHLCEVPDQTKLTFVIEIRTVLLSRWKGLTRKRDTENFLMREMSSILRWVWVTWVPAFVKTERYP